MSSDYMDVTNDYVSLRVLPPLQFVPKFCKRYAQLGETIRQGLESFKADVENGCFPSEEYSPYKVRKGTTISNI